MISSIISRLVILLFGTLYPAYASYKAVRTKNVKEYLKWMMYWIVFALFTCVETFTDVFFGFWFPFYYEIKIVLVLWLLSPATKGSSFLYRRFVHPMLAKREPEIDEYIARAKEQGYTTILQLGSQGMSFATNVIMQTAIKKMPMAGMADEYQQQQQQQQQQRHVTDGAGGEDLAHEDLMAFSDEDSSMEEYMPRATKATAAQKKASAAKPRRGRSAVSTKGGGGIVNHLKKSYSLCDLSKDIDLRADLNRNSMGLPEESVDGVRELHSEMRTRSARQKAAAAGAAVAASHMDLYFPEVDVNIRSHNSRESAIPLSQIRSTDDISSGFVSSETVYSGEGGVEGLVRSGSLNTARPRRTRDELASLGAGRGRISKRGLSTEDSDEFELEDDAGIDLRPTLTQLPLSTYSTVPYSSPTDQIPFLVNSNMNQLNNQLAFINLLQANQAFMNRFLAQGNRVDSMVFGRNSSGVIVDELVSELGSTENLTKLISEESGQSEILDEKYCSKPNENQNNMNIDETKLDKPEQKTSFKAQKVEKIDQNSTLDKRFNEEEQILKPKQVITNNVELISSSEHQTNKNELNVSPKEHTSTDMVEKSLPAQQLVTKTEAAPNNESGAVNKSLDNVVEKCLEDISLGNNEVKSPTPRKGRYGKKVAPRPPSVYVSNEDQEIENEDFQDAESEIEGNEFLGKAPDLISELGEETKSEKLPTSHKNTESPEVNVMQIKSKDEIPIKRSDSTASTSESIVKTKEKHSKFSKLLPKTSHSFLNFFSLKEPSRSDTKSLKGSSENVQISSRSSPARDDPDGIIIPLTDDDPSANDNLEFFESYQDPVKEDGDMNNSKDNKDEEFEIRDMSQSPTTKRKNI